MSTSEYKQHNVLESGIDLENYIREKSVEQHRKGILVANIMALNMEHVLAYLYRPNHLPFSSTGNVTSMPLWIFSIKKPAEY
jgi:hypothetical protein